MNGIDTFKLEAPIEFPEVPKDLAGDGQGVWTFIHRGHLLEKVKQHYGRESQKLCVKVIRQPYKGDINEHYWGYYTATNQYDPKKGSPVLEAVKIQNIYAMADLAPRVYAVFAFEQPPIKTGEPGEQYIAMLTEDMGKDDENVDLDKWYLKLQNFASNNEIEPFLDGRVSNVVGGVWVDFQGFKFKEGYEEQLRKNIDGIAKWGPFSNYQTIKELDMKGGRDIEHRIEKLKLGNLDFRNKTVLDIGCSAGVFCNYAVDKGAKYVMGIETPEIAVAARQLSNYLGYFNIDYIGCDLKNVTYEDFTSEITGGEKFDIVLLLSMTMHIGYPEYIDKLVKDILVWEGNSRDADTAAKQNIWENYTVLMESLTEDLFPRPVIIARKK